MQPCVISLGSPAIESAPPRRLLPPGNAPRARQSGDGSIQRIEADGWAKESVEQLAAYIAQREPGRRGFSAQNLWRMRQFFQAYSPGSKLSTLLREIPWSSHLHVLDRTKHEEEREFYLRVPSPRPGA
ncbi:DUF1016 N-terminal domain-containing protein [Variovorax sp. 38R]|uniref:DUF1016 N-terminal domain-containing protein n=1 Tax=Variovorax sp. 38R TaxID=2774875 RepID=UPI001CE05196|nr:DUF1016 N-terminal domain-containing protein [Variovorax sp. 38R]